MNKYIDADRLIEYLEKEADKEFKKTEENANSPVLCHFHNGCRMQALDTIDFIKELQQEQPSEDLAEEIKRYIPSDQCPVPDLMKAVARHFAEWQKAQKPVVTHGETYQVDTLGTQQVIAGKMPQKPGVWSEEDEKRVKQLIYDTEFIKAHYEKIKEKLGERFNNALIRDCDEQIAWLKSLCSRPKPSDNWKPSEEQMEALEYVIRDYREDSCNATANYLQEILDHLKNM